MKRIAPILALIALLAAYLRMAEWPVAYSDESGHLFRFVSDTDPTISDSGRSEATLGGEQ